MKNTNDLKDIQKFYDEETKWYWYLPLVGFFIMNAAYRRFSNEKKLAVTNMSLANPDYEYTPMPVSSLNIFRTIGTTEMSRRIGKFHSYTLGISLIIMLVVEMFIFNFTPFLLKKFASSVQYDFENEK